MQTGYRIIALVVLGFSCIGTTALAGVIDRLVPHRAIYDVRLDNASDRSGIKAMDGRIAYQITGSACEGFAISFRFVSRVSTRSKTFVSDQRTTTFEDADGKSFRFLTRSYLNEKLEKELRGYASTKDSGVKVELSKPDKKQFELSPAMFTNTHMIKVIEAAINQQTLLTADVYDGSEDGNEIMSTNTIIGKSRSGISSDDDENGVAGPIVGKNSYWPVSISYFDQKAAGEGESLPLYQVSFLLYENGISRALKMNYADYTLKGTLSNLELLPVSSCN